MCVRRVATDAPVPFRPRGLFENRTTFRFLGCFWDKIEGPYKAVGPCWTSLGAALCSCLPRFKRNPALFLILG